MASHVDEITIARINGYTYPNEQHENILFKKYFGKDRIFCDVDVILIFDTSRPEPKIYPYAIVCIRTKEGKFIAHDQKSGLSLRSSSFCNVLLKGTVSRRLPLLRDTSPGGVNSSIVAGTDRLNSRNCNDCPLLNSLNRIEELLLNALCPSLSFALRDPRIQFSIMSDPVLAHCTPSVSECGKPEMMAPLQLVLFLVLVLIAELYAFIFQTWNSVLRSAASCMALIIRESIQGTVQYILS